MIRQRNQFDIHRTEATAATPTCCCCCCLTTLASTTVILGERVHKDAKDVNPKSRTLLTVLAYLYLPIVFIAVKVSFELITRATKSCDVNGYESGFSNFTTS